MNTTQPAIHPCLTIDEVAKRLNVSKRKVEEMIANGDIIGFRVGRQWRMKPERLEHWIDLKEKQTA